MSSLLYRLGRWCAGRALRVLAVWLAILVLLGGAVGLVGVRLTDSFTISGTESMDGLEVLGERLPQVAGTGEQILVAASDGDITSHSEAVEDLVEQVSRLDGVATVSAPFGDPATGTASTVSSDGAHVLVQVQADPEVASVVGGTTSRATVLAQELEDLAQATQEADPALSVRLSGDIGAEVGVALSSTELVGVVVAALVLLITLGSVLAAGAPLLSAAIGVGTGVLGILLAAAATDISSTTLVLAVMIGLAVGIDYALLIISRAREHLADGLGPVEAAGRAVATAGSAVVLAGTTVVVALCGLGVAGIRFLTTMGVASAAVVAVDVLVALTAVPALVGLIGTRLAPRPRGTGLRGRRRPAGLRDRATRPAARWVRATTRRPWLTIGAVVLLLGLCAVPLSGLHLALTDNGFAEKGSQQRETYDAIAEAYGEGYTSPILVIADIATTPDPVAVVDALAQDVSTLKGVETVSLATPNEDGTLALIQIRPEESQASSATMGLVEDIRDHAEGYERAHGVKDVMVTGQSAVAIDVASSLNAALLPFGVVVVGLSLLLLMVVFRSVAVPLTATLGYLLSLAAGTGAVGAVFGWGWAADLLAVSKVGAVISFLPVIVMGVLFGLAMDYEVFLVARMREDWIRLRPPEPSTRAQRRQAAVAAVESGFVGSARVVGAAAAIMVGVFAAFIHSDDVSIKPIALGLTVGVVADALAVRMTLVPAVMVAMGERAWWLPAWLDRQLPVIDVEGEGLGRTLEHEEWSASHGHAVVRAEGLSLADAEGAVLEDLDLVLREGEVGLLRAPSPLTRRALAAALGGRLRPAAGLLAVDDHVLPDGTASVQSVTTVLRGWDDEVPAHVRLVVVDDPGQRRWSRVRSLAGSGTAVLVTLPAGTPLRVPAPQGRSAEEEGPDQHAQSGVAPAVVVDVDAAGRATTLSGASLAPAAPPAPGRPGTGRAGPGPSEASAPAGGAATEPVAGPAAAAAGEPAAVPAADPSDSTHGSEARS